MSSISSLRRVPVLILGAALLFFLSGFASLVYQILWMRELGLLFGVTAYAAATTAAAFFLGLGAGSAFFGARPQFSSRPLLTYGLLELAISVAALLFFGLTAAYRSIYPVLFESLSEHRAGFLMAKFALSVLILFPPAFLMGGTLPVISRFITSGLAATSVARRVPVFYGINTFGAASGALVAGFFLPQWLGVTGSYWFAVGVTTFVGLTAIGLGLKFERSDSVSVSAVPSEKLSLPKYLVGLSFFSGFSTLALEVLWTRMFAQTLHNSVYSYAIILVTFLIALAIGSWVAGWLAGRFSNEKAPTVLIWILSISGLLTLASPIMFHYFASDRGGYLGDSENWPEYLRLVFTAAGITVFPATLALGVLFPYLLKLSEKQVDADAGRVVGRLAAVNIGGAVLGSLAGGFVMLDLFGLWSSIRLLAVCYLLLVFAFLAFDKGAYSEVRSRLSPAAILAMVSLLLAVTWLDPTQLPKVYYSPVKRGEVLLNVDEGSDATVAVVRRDKSVRIKVNNFYVLGSSGKSTDSERFQSYLPLVVHPDPKRVFFLGMGTGITAGGALDVDEVEAVTVAELLPGVIEASQQFFKPWLNGLFTDERVNVVAEDGRNYLSATRNQFDVIVSDLFIPWRNGVGSLYTVDHYQRAADRLESGGIYAQWIPLFQVSEDECAMIANSMQQAFPMVTMWRGDFSPNKSVACLIGHRTTAPLQWEVFKKRSIALNQKLGLNQTSPLKYLAGHLTFYTGNITASNLVSEAPLNTDNNPRIEYQAPINHRAEKAGEQSRFIGRPLLDFYDELQQTVPFSQDPWLEEVPPHAAQIVDAGHVLHELNYAQNRNEAEAKAAASKQLSEIIYELEIRYGQP